MIYKLRCQKPGKFLETGFIIFAKPTQYWRLLDERSQSFGVRNANLVAAFKQVVASPNPVRIERDLAFRLRSMRLVKFIGNDVVPLCDLYRQYFCDRLGV